MFGDGDVRALNHEDVSTDAIAVGVLTQRLVFAARALKQHQTADVRLDQSQRRAFRKDFTCNSDVGAPLYAMMDGGNMTGEC